MTLQELYAGIGGDYAQAVRVLRIEKLIDKHIRKFAQNGVVDSLLAAGETMDPVQLFETAHAVKGVCGNLGLTNLAAAASEITEAYRPGNPRTLTTAETAGKLETVAAMYQKIREGIRRYAEENPQ